MNKIQRKRIDLIIFFGLILFLGVGLILYALKQNINVFITPSDLANNVSTEQLRLGGIVKANSIIRSKNSLAVTFTVTDNKKELQVVYLGILPDLFRENKGVIVEGKIQQGRFIASRVLAKHDENYMPKAVYQSLREKIK